MYSSTEGGLRLFGTYCRLGLPVWSTDREVIAAALRKLKRSARKGRKHREGRHAFLRCMLNNHHAAQQLCREYRL
jgi:hypothetical protein